MPARDDEPTPPSFTPDGGRARPTPDGARVVGGQRPRPPAPERVVRRTPPAEAPRRTPTRSAGGDSSTARPGAAAGAGSAARRGSTARPGSAARPVPPARPASTARPASIAPSGRAPGPGPASDRTSPARSTAPRSAASRGPAPAARRTAPTASDATRRRPRARALRWGLLLVVVALLAWPIGLLVWADGLLQHTPALSGGADTPGTTYLLAGSDARGDEGGVAQDGTEGQRTDTILLLHDPADGPTALISLPRDTYVEVPGHGAAKLNSSFAWGGAPLLVQTVEGLTGLTVDHYVEIGMGGVTHLVDAVGGVNLCHDADVNDPESGMVWTAGCHDVDGTAALAFARMRKSDPLGDVGRAMRQRQLIAAAMGRIEPRSLLLDPAGQVRLVDAGTGAMTFDEDAGVLDVARLALAFRAANGPEGVRGTPPIASMDHRPGGIGSTVLLDPDLTPGFFGDVRDGRLSPGEVGGSPNG